MIKKAQKKAFKSYTGKNMTQLTQKIQLASFSYQVLQYQGKGATMAQIPAFASETQKTKYLQILEDLIGLKPKKIREGTRAKQRMKGESGNDGLNVVYN